MKYLVGNFKNKLLLEDILKYNKELGELDFKKSKLILCPTSLFLPFFTNNKYSLGAQDISSFIDYSITGEITGEQLKSMGVTYVIIGHSERRNHLREINIDFINKIGNALASDIKVIYCIGETLKDKEEGNTYLVLEKQISEVLNNIEIKNIMIAYEPVWAIGKGVTPSTEDIKDIVKFIKDTIKEKYDEKIEVLYGGSVNPHNIEELLTVKNVDGFLVGGATLNPQNVKEMLSKIEKE